MKTFIKTDAKTIEKVETSETKSVYDIEDLKKRKAELEFELTQINEILTYDK